MYRILAILGIGAVALHAQGAVSMWSATTPAAPRLFNDGLWRGMSAGVEASIRLPTSSVLFDLPLEFAVGAEYIRPTWSSVVLLDDYRGWTVRASLLWRAGERMAPYIRLGGGASLGERFRREVVWDSTAARRWLPARSFIAFWGIGVRGRLISSLAWYLEAELLTGDELLLLLPLRLGVSYRWGTR